MIIEYHRPKTIDEAVALINRKNIKTVPMGGGNVLSKYSETPYAVVDLQELGLSEIKTTHEIVYIGATSTLSDVENKVNHPAFTSAIQIQAGKNQRNSATIAGLIKSANGRSTLLTLLLALDAQLIWEPNKIKIALGDWLPQRETWNKASFISGVEISIDKIVFESIGRSEKDLPIICAAIAVWSSNRMRIAIGGFGKIPLLVLDGKTTDNVSYAVEKALSDANDEWASAAYRKEAGSKLTTRLLDQIFHNAG